MSEDHQNNTAAFQEGAWRTDALHLFPLWGFAVAQPLFNVLSNSPEFFVAHRFTGVGFFILAAAVSLGAPLVLAILEGGIKLVSERARVWTHLFIVAVIGGAVVLGSINLFLDVATIVHGVLAISGGLVIAVLYASKEGLRRFFTILSPAALLFPVFFLFFSPISELIFARTAEVETASVQSRTPIVVIVFDEFNPTALLSEDRRIDDVRFPNFAKLASNAYWFPNATGIHKQTLAALPAIVAGRIPGTELPPPTYSEYPQNLFTWLGGSYRLNVWESITSLCSPDLCESAKTGSGFDFPVFVSDLALVYAHILVPPQHRDQWLPPLDTGWKGFGEGPDGSHNVEHEERTAQEIIEENFGDASAGRAEIFENFLSRIESGDATLDFAHVLVPHLPYQYLSDGSEYASAIEGRVRGVWSDNEYLVAVAYQRYLHQVGFVDGLIGRLIARLKAVGKYDEAMIIITADHGVSFEPGTPHREPVEGNAAAVFTVPLIIKLPGQMEGVVSERYVSTVDLIATIADVIGEAPPWIIDGESALSIKTQNVTLPRDGEAEFDVFEFSTSEQLDWQIDTFGTGIELGRTVLRSEFADLIGQDISNLERGLTPDGPRLSSDAIQHLATVDRSRGLVPVMFSGELENVASRTHWVALALNGEIAAVAPTYEKGAASHHLRAMFPPDVILDGHNVLNAFLIRGSEQSPVLVPVQYADPETYRVVRDGGVEMIQSSSGKSYRIEQGTVRGYLDRLSQHRATVQLRGWAVDAKNGALPESVLAQVNGEEFHVAELGLSRPDVAEALNNARYALSGFHILIPGADREIRSLRIFVLSENGYAGEIPIRPEMINALRESKGKHIDAELD